MAAWSVNEEIILKKNYSSISIEDLDKLLPIRTRNAIYTKANRMGLKKYDKNVRFVHNNGYIVVRDDSYPRDWGGAWIRRSTGIYVYEHCKIWHDHFPDLKIKSNEVIHHIDNDRTNNEISNLAKMTRSEHSRNTMLGEWYDIPGVEAMIYPPGSTV